MKPSIFCCLALSAALLAPAALAQTEAASTEVIETCPLPAKPSIPNGRTATEQEMLETQKNIKAYIEKGNAVLTCLDELRTKWGEAATEEQLQINTLFHTKMVDDMQAIGALFNSAVRAYKGKQ